MYVAALNFYRSRIWRVDAHKSIKDLVTAWSPKKSVSLNLEWLKSY
jgi:hypothetical protein